MKIIILKRPNCLITIFLGCIKKIMNKYLPIVQKSFRVMYKIKTFILL